MKSPASPRPVEQRRVEKLLAKLAKMQPYSVSAGMGPGNIRTENIGLSPRIRNFNAGLASQST
jgi:hypothetical protein